jgi:hypothetical protein
VLLKTRAMLGVAHTLLPGAVQVRAGEIMSAAEVHTGRLIAGKCEPRPPKPPAVPSPNLLPQGLVAAGSGCGLTACWLAVDGLATWLLLAPVGWLLAGSRGACWWAVGGSVVG